MAERAKDIERETFAGDEVKRLTDLKFKIITRTEIEKKLNVRYFDDNYFFNETFFPLPCVVTIVGTVVDLAYGFSQFLDNHSFLHALVNKPMGYTLAVAAGLFAACAISSFRSARILSKNLSRWEDDIPYGGLLAVKEAKEKGFTEFTVFYPAKQEKPLPKDPVIVAHGKYGVMVEVFAWDNGKLYD